MFSDRTTLWKAVDPLRHWRHARNRDLSRRKVRWPSLVIVLLGVVLGIGVTAGAYDMQQEASRHAHAASLATSFESAVTDQDNTFDGVYTRESVTAELSADIAEGTATLDESFEELSSSTVPMRQLPTMRAALERYKAAFNAHLDYLHRHHPTRPDGEDHYDHTVDPVKQELLDPTQTLIVDLSSRSQALKLRATQFIYAFLPTTLLGMLVALAFGRAVVRNVGSRHDARLRSLLRNASDLTCVTDATGQCTFATPSSARLIGVPHEVLSNRNLGDIADRTAVAAAIDRASSSAREGAASVALQVTLADGRRRRLEGTCLDLRHDAMVGGFVWNLRDATGQHELETRLVHQAHHDPLTSLANRALFHQRATELLDEARRGGAPFALMLLDVDHFKTINDTLGHKAGDAVLVTIAARCGTAARPDDLVARIGGDEFAVLLANANADAATADRIAERVCALLARPLQVDGAVVRPTASIGVAAADAGAPSVDALLHDADTAMYAAKAAGRACYRLHDPKLADEHAA
jgi:diguanylate cyclase (GGDEF)-like protein/PAS domain S-box-containing protein